jgi:hypothetical protein
MAIALWKDMKEPILLDGEPDAPVFGNNGLLDATSLADKLESERSFIDGHPPLPEVTRENVQIAQGWNGIPPVAPPRYNPGSRGYDIPGREALGGIGDVPRTLDQNAEFRAQGRQRDIWGKFESDKLRLGASQSQNSHVRKLPDQTYWTAGKNPAPLGPSWKTSEGKTYTDRNDDGTPDRIFYHRDGKTYVDYGDENGLSVYDPRQYRPPPNRRY